MLSIDVPRSSPCFCASMLWAMGMFKTDGMIVIVLLYLRESSGMAIHSLPFTYVAGEDMQYVVGVRGWYHIPLPSLLYHCLKRGRPCCVEIGNRMV
jgi:hypothetical protein